MTASLNYGRLTFKTTYKSSEMGGLREAVRVGVWLARFDGVRYRVAYKESAIAGRAY